MKKINIAIDGYSSTGKSTIAKKLAAKLGYIYVDTGAMYRAVALYAMQNKLIKASYFNKELLIGSLDKISLNFKFNPDLGYAEMYLNNINVEAEIRSIKVSSFVSTIAEVSEVREKLVEQQQEMGKNKGIVMDGRDIGTVVFPKAELKIFMTASSEIRTQRRFDELSAKGDNVTFKEVKENIEHRDKVDTTRADSPLVQAKDALLFDNSFLSRQAQFEKLLKLVNEIQNSL
ncbi:MAG: (d)CMP kinase [Flavobacteriales bacterium]|jgi:CMP/dCMP kinase|nr:(d)CMP kinase [Flavobacteriales bacterium]